MRRCLPPATLWLCMALGCSGADRPAATPAAASAPASPAAAPAAPDPPRAAPAAPLPAVTLPDLSALAPSVREQIRSAFESVDTNRADAAEPPHTRALRFAALGHVLMAATFFDEAVLCYQHAEAAEPAEKRWPYLRGHALLKRGDRAGAIAAFERTLALQPYVPALVWLGDMYLDTGQVDRAQAAYARAVSMLPASAAAHFGAGRAALAPGSHAEAITHLEDALRLAPDATAINYPLAMAYRAAGNRAQAESLLQRRGSRVPALDDEVLREADVTLASAVSLEGIGMQALRRQDWKAAVEAYQRAVDLAPADPSPRYWLATALFAAGDAAGAEREFNTVVRTSPTFARGYFSLAVIYERRGQQAEALRAFEAAARYAPNLPEARLRLAETRRALGRVAESVPEYEAAVALDPALGDAWVGGAQALVALGRTADARQWITRARTLHPERPELAALEQRLR